MNKDRNIIASISFVIVLMWLFFSTITEFLVKNVLIDKLHMNNAITAINVTGNINGGYPREVYIDYEELYPIEKFQANVYEQDEANDGIEFDNYIIIDGKNSKLGNVVEKVKSILESYCTDYVVFREEYKAVSGFFDLLIGNNMIDEINSVVTDNEGKIIIRSPFPDDLSNKANSFEKEKFIADYSRLKTLADEEDIDLIYVCVINSENKYDSTFVGKYGQSIGNYNQDALLDILKSLDIKTLDLREKYYEDGLNHRSGFFDTDNHWNPRTGLWAAAEIAKFLNENGRYNFDIERFSEDKFDSVIYEKSIFGEIGKSATLARLPYGDTEMLYPSFDTDMEIKIETLGVEEKGNFYDTMMDKEVLASNAILYQNAHSAILYGKPALTEIKNNAPIANGNKKILMLRDSFGQVVAPYLALQTGALDLLCDQSFNGSVYTYIKETKPDAIIVLYGGVYDPLNHG